MKRKCDNADGQESLRKQAAVRCILHVSGIQHGDFTPLSNVKGLPLRSCRIYMIFGTGASWNLEIHQIAWKISVIRSPTLLLV